VFNVDGFPEEEIEKLQENIAYGFGCNSVVKEVTSFSVNVFSKESYTEIKKVLGG